MWAKTDASFSGLAMAFLVSLPSGEGRNCAPRAGVAAEFQVQILLIRPRLPAPRELCRYNGATCRYSTSGHERDESTRELARWPTPRYSSSWGFSSSPDW